MVRAVVAVGGWAHPGDDLVAAMTSLLEPRGIESVIVRDSGELVETLEPGCDLLIVGACWFSMNDDRYSTEQRAEFAVDFSPELRDALTTLKGQGCPLLALHTAIICFDGHELWRDWLGATWNWETSWHPEPQQMPVVSTPTSGLGISNFSVVDELYQGLDIEPTVDVVAQSESGDSLVWRREVGMGRVAVNVLGHDARSLEVPEHRALNGQLIDWLMY